MTRSIASRKPGSLRSPSLPGLFPRGWFDDMVEYLQPGNGDLAEMMQVSMDVVETDKAFEVKMDLPGVRPEDVEIQVERNTLNVRGHRQSESETNDEATQIHRLERFSGSFARSVVLPNSINEDEASAEFRDGVLVITIPKQEDARPRKISIRS